MKRNLMTCFIVLLVADLYFNLLPNVVHMNDVVRFLHLLSFFPLLHLLAKFTNRGEISSFGLTFHKGWGRNFRLGLSIGICGYLVLYGIRFLMGQYEWVGFKSLNDVFSTLVIVLFGYGVGSLGNDLLTRGILFGYLKGKIPLGILSAISILVYALDDAWNEGFSIENTIFSIVLGLSLTYAFVQANAVWGDTGIHFGLNFICGILFGVSGNVGDGILLFHRKETSSFFLDHLSIFIALMMFIVVFLLRKKFIAFHRTNADE